MAGGLDVIVAVDLAGQFLEFLGFLEVLFNPASCLVALSHVLDSLIIFQLSTFQVILKGLFLIHSHTLSEKIQVTQFVHGISVPLLLATFQQFDGVLDQLSLII